MHCNGCLSEDMKHSLTAYSNLKQFTHTCMHAHTHTHKKTAAEVSIQTENTLLWSNINVFHFIIQKQRWEGHQANKTKIYNVIPIPRYPFSLL